MNTNVMERTVADVLGEALDAESESLWVIAPDAETVEALIEVIDDSAPHVRLLADSDTLKNVMRDFLVAGRAADHIEADRLEIRTSDKGTNTLLITGTSVIAVIHTHDRAAGLTTEDSDFIESANERFSAAWDDAEAYTLRTPPLSKVKETLEAELGKATADDFDSVVSSLETIRGDDDGLDEVAIALLVAAKNEDLLYDISKWGENVEIASKATFSRTKTRMEEEGLIDTEKVPIDVGRPRLRLKLANDRLRDADAEELADIARSIVG